MVPRRLDPGEDRTPERIRVHYLLERELATQLKCASRDERRRLYGEVYDELYRRIPDLPHGCSDTTDTSAARAARAAYQMKFLRPFLRPGSVFAEIGAGDCSLSLAVADIASEVYACDVSKFVLEGRGRQNLHPLVFDGITLPLPSESCDVIYSNQVLEHLHPEDAFDQVVDIFRCLRPRGRFLCMTPNGLAGPGDVSKYFCDQPEGFHLREYTNKEMAGLLRWAGFSAVRAYMGVKVRYVSPPLGLEIGLENVLGRLPRRLRLALARNLPVSAMLGIRMVATK